MQQNEAASNMKKEDIQKILEDLNALKCKTAKDVEEARVRYLGKRGEITALRRINDSIIAFQTKGVSQILYNEQM